MTLLWVGVIAIVLGAGLLLFRRPLTAWNARGADAMKSEHIRQVTEPNDGAPGYIVGVGALILTVGVVLAVAGAVQSLSGSVPEWAVRDGQTGHVN